MSDLRSAYEAIPAGDPSVEQVLAELPALYAAIEQALDERDRLAVAFGAYMRSEEGAGSVQPRVVVDLAEAVGDVLNLRPAVRTGHRAETLDDGPKVAARTPSQPDLREALRAADRLAQAVLSWQSGHVVEARAHEYVAASRWNVASQPAPAAPPQPWREASRRLHEVGDDTDDGLVPTHARRPGDSLDVEEASPDRLSGSNRSHPSQPTPSQPDLREAAEQAVATWFGGDTESRGHAEAMDALRAALASQPAPAAPEKP